MYICQIRKKLAFIWEMVDLNMNKRGHFKTIQQCSFMLALDAYYGGFLVK